MHQQTTNQAVNSTKMLTRALTDIRLKQIHGQQRYYSRTKTVPNLN